MRWILPSTSTSRCRLALAYLFLLMAPGLSQATAAGQVEAGLFSSASLDSSLPDDWQPLSFSQIDRQTDYSLVKEQGVIVIKAVSDQSASGLTRALSIDPAVYPVIRWRWKVNNVLERGDVTRKDGDDYPARIYISFAFDTERAGYLERLEYAAARLVFGPDVPYRAISYIWGSNSPVGTVVENPYTDRVMMFVVESGSDKLQQWQSESRNVYADYLAAFGEQPGMISGVAIMTDTDNTRESAVAWYGDVIFSQK